MQISGPKTCSVFDRYNIVSESDIKTAMERTEKHLQAQQGHNLGAMASFDHKKGATR
jgi:hypothetical protein